MTDTPTGQFLELPATRPPVERPADDRAASDASAPRVPSRGGRLPWRPSRAAILALLTGLAVTAALTITALAVYNRNERRLLNLRVRQLSLVISATTPATQTPLATGAELASATGGAPLKFRSFMSPYVGPGRQFASASLWRLGPGQPALIAVVGAAPQLASLPDTARRFFATTRPGVLNLTGILGSARPAVGLDYIAPGRRRSLVVYGENPLPANRRSGLERNTAFSDLYYALYLGRSQRRADLLVTNVRGAMTGRKAAEVVPFGAAAFTLVVTARGSLGGTFFRILPWLIAGLGALLSLSAALLTDRLAYGRRRAERLASTLDRVAAENRELYTEQRSISQTLQHALLPDTMPQLRGLRTSALYVPAASGVEVGGDWYDVIAVDDRHAFLVIGDVSGHGLRAATTMALLRHAVLAYVAQDSRPAAVLAKLAQFVNRDPHSYFATVLCLLIDADAHELTVASAGHLAPLLLNGGTGEFLDLRPDVAIGVARHAPSQYHETTASVPPNATLVAFTDGLVERRGEVIDVGLARLRAVANNPELELDELLATLARELTSDRHHDDTAIVGIQWQT